jgi:hypothetical protein
MAEMYKNPPHEMVENAKRLEAGKELTPHVPANRTAAALQLRLQGAGYDNIAEVLGLASPAEARKFVDKALAEMPTDMESVERIRDLESRRIERILVSLMKRGTNPKDPDHLAYARTALAAIKQQTDLYGAAMPTKVDISYNPSAQQLEQWVSQIGAAMHKNVVEGDIIDVEILEEKPAEKPKHGLSEF